MSTYKVEAIHDSLLHELGEGPHWDIKTQSLYYVDILKASLHCFDYRSNKTYNATVDNVKYISFIIPVKERDNEFVIGTGNSLSVINWDGKSAKGKIIKNISEVDVPEVRFNDGKVDPTSRFLFSGTMRAEEHGSLLDTRLGTLYNYSTKKGFASFQGNIGISNGLAWNEKANKFYYIDTVDYNVKEYDYNNTTGEIKNERIVIDFLIDGKEPGFAPDGMTIDEKGYLYVACFGGSKVLKINPKIGKIEMEINIPTAQITSVAFGGPNLDVLFVTTAAAAVLAGPQTPPAGSLFKITGLDVKGTKMQEFSLS